MQISQETALLIDTLATAASKIGSTPASAKLNALIVELLPPSELDEAHTVIATLQAERVELHLNIEGLVNTNRELQISSDIHQENRRQAEDQLIRFAQLSSLAEPSTEQNEELQALISRWLPAMAPVDA